MSGRVPAPTGPPGPTRMRLNNLEEVERRLLSFGTHATVVRPNALRERFRAIMEGFVGRYAPEHSPASTPAAARQLPRA